MYCIDIISSIFQLLIKIYLEYLIFPEKNIFNHALSYIKKERGKHAVCVIRCNMITYDQLKVMFKEVL